MRAVLQRVREASVRVVEPPGDGGPAGVPKAERGRAGGTARSGGEPSSFVAEGARIEREVVRIGPGLLVLVGFAGGESPVELEWLAEKILGLRLFGPSGEFDRSVVEMGGEVLVVSQFTLLAGLGKGRRPDFAGAAPAETARPLYEGLIARLVTRFPNVRQGVFGAEMRVALVNDGPATFLLEPGAR